MAKDKTEAMAECKNFRSKVERLMDPIYDLIYKMPNKGDTEEISQKICLLNALNEFDHSVSGTTPDDFIEGE